MMSNPNLLQIFNRYLHPGGEEASVHRVRDTISTQHEIHLCQLDSHDWQGAGAPSLFGQALRMWRNPEALQRILAEHQEHETNVWLLHNLFPVASAGVYPLARKHNIPTVQYIHNFRPFSVNGYLWTGDRIEPAGLRKNFWPEIRSGAWQDSKLKTAWYAMILTALHRSGAFHHVNAWIAISSFMKQTFVEAGIPESKVFVIPHSWDISEPATPNPVDKGYYLFLGRICPEKGVGFLLEVWDKLFQHKGSACPPLYVCGEGPLAAEVSSRAAANPMVKYLGPVTGETKRKLIRECRAMIAPSLWWEPLGLVTYEAYEFCKPMLAAASGGLSETVFHGETGFLHSPGNPGELIDQVLELEASPAKAARMGQAGRKWLESSTSREQWLDRFNAVLDRLS